MTPSLGERAASTAAAAAAMAMALVAYRSCLVGSKTLGRLA